MIPSSQTSINTQDTSNLISSILAHNRLNQSQLFCNNLNDFGPLLKDNFENVKIWKQFSLTLLLANEPPCRVLNALKECLRIDKQDPVPAMLAAKLMILSTNNSKESLDMINEGIKRSEQNPLLLARCYLIASVINAHLYEQEPKSIQKLKSYLKNTSLEYLKLALNKNSNDYLVYFHIALHKAKDHSFPEAIKNVKRAIELNPKHLPSILLLLLCLSSLKLHDEAMVVCDSSLYEFQDNLMLLYIKCNLELNYGDSKSALNTAQYILKCIRKSSAVTLSSPKSSPVDQSKKNNNNSGEPDKDHMTRSQTTSNLFSESKELTSEFTIWLLIAQIFMKMSLFNDAEQCINQAALIETKALSYELMYVRGMLAKANNNINDAKNYFQSSIALNPKHALALQQLGHVYHLLGNNSTGQKLLNDSLDLDSDSYLTWYYLSLVLLKANQAEKASDCVMQAIKLESISPVLPLSTISRLTLE